MTLVCGTTEARVENPYAAANEAFPFRRNTVSFQMFLCNIPEQQVNIGVIKLSCDHKAHAFDSALVNKITVHEDTPWGL